MNINKLLSLFLVYKYPLIFGITIIEGAIIMTMSGLLLRLGYVSFWPVYLTLMAGDLVGDAFWYYVGYYFAHPITEKYGKYIGVSAEIIEKTKKIFQNHEKKILFISKITMGFGFPLVALLVAGMTKMSFRKYITSLFLGQIIYTGVLLSVGYFFGDVYTKIDKSLQIVSVIIFLIVVFFVVNGIRSYLRKRNG